MNNYTDLERDERQQKTIKFLQKALVIQGLKKKTCPVCRCSH